MQPRIQPFTYQHLESIREECDMNCNRSIYHLFPDPDFGEVARHDTLKHCNPALFKFHINLQHFSDAPRAWDLLIPDLITDEKLPGHAKVTFIHHSQKEIDQHLAKMAMLDKTLDEIFAGNYYPTALFRDEKTADLIKKPVALEDALLAFENEYREEKLSLSRLIGVHITVYIHAPKDRVFDPAPYQALLQKIPAKLRAARIAPASESPESDFKINDYVSLRRNRNESGKYIDASKADKKTDAKHPLVHLFLPSMNLSEEKKSDAFLEKLDKIRNTHKTHPLPLPANEKIGNVLSLLEKLIGEHTKPYWQQRLNLTIFPDAFETAGKILSDQKHSAAEKLSVMRDLLLNRKFSRLFEPDHSKTGLTPKKTYYTCEYITRADPIDPIYLRKLTQLTHDITAFLKQSLLNEINLQIERLSTLRYRIFHRPLPAEGDALQVCRQFLINNNMDEFYKNLTRLNTMTSASNETASLLKKTILLANVYYRKEADQTARPSEEKRPS